jgi:hypothetical protein
MAYTPDMEGYMEAQKTTRLDMRITAVLRGKLAEEAGPHGSLSGVARWIIERYFAKKDRR